MTAQAILAQTITYVRARESSVIWAASVLSLTCLAYFYALDRVFFSSTGFSPIFRYLLTSYDVQAARLALAICLLAILWRWPAPILSVVDGLGLHPKRASIGCSALIALGTVFVYQNYPLAMDEYAALFQAKIFASGQLSAYLPTDYLDWLVVKGFNGAFLIASHQSGRVIGAYWPGFALLLTSFEFLHVPWLCNALLAGLTLYLIHWITFEITKDKRAAGWALLFALASCVFVANAISYYSMQAHLCTNLLFAALLLRPTARRSFIAGLVGSLALTLHNPFPHTLFALPWLAASILVRDRRRSAPALVLGYLPGLCVAVLWIGLRASISTEEFQLSGIGKIVGGVFSLPDSKILNIRAASFAKILVWELPGLIPFALLGYFRHRQRLQVGLFAGSACLTLMGYFFVTFDQGHGWGNRYFHSAWGVLPILAGCSMTARSNAVSRLVSFIGASSIMSLLIIMPFQLAQIHGFISVHLAQLGPARAPGNNVFFIHPGGGFYVADMVQIDPLLRNENLMMVSRGEKLDGEMVLQNWPNAKKLASEPAFDQWYLGETDVRRPIPGRNFENSFVLAPLKSTTPPSVEGR